MCDVIVCHCSIFSGSSLPVTMTMQPRDVLAAHVLLEPPPKKQP